MAGFYLSIVENLGILALLSAGVALLRPYTQTIRIRWMRDAALGVLFALAAVVVMFDPVRIPEGATFDARGGPALLAGVVGGPIAAVVTAVIGAIARWHVGGPVALGGAVSFLLYGAAGLVCGLAIRRSGWPWSPITLALIAVFGTVCVLPSFFISADWALATAILAKAGPALLLANIVGSVVLGSMLGLVHRRQDLNAALVEREAEASKLALVASRTTNAVIITDAAGRIEWVNDGFTRITGFPATEALGCKPGDFLQGPETDPATVEAMRAAIAAGQSFENEVVNYRKDGTPYWIAIEAQPIYENGVLRRFIAIESDVTERKRLERNLLRAEQLAKAGHWTLHLDDGRIAWSHETYAIFELDPADGEPELEDALARYHPEDRGDIREILRDASARGRGFAYRKRLLINGRVKHVEVKAEPLKGPADTSPGFFGTIQDVTEIVEAAAAQQRQEDRFRAMADTIPGVTYQWELTADGQERFTYVSPNTVEVLGVSAEALFRDWRNFAVDERDRDAFEQSVADALTNRHDWSFTGRRHHPELGTRWFRANAKLLATDTGDLVYNGIIVDVTDETEIRKKLEVSEARLRTLMDAIPAEVDYTDARGIVTYANLAARRAVKTKKDDAAPYRWQHAWGNDVPDDVREAVDRALDGERATYTACWASDGAEDGVPRIFDATLVPDMDDSGQVRGVFGIAFDVTDYRQRELDLARARDEADAASRAKSVFLASMSHELRTPLNAINGYAEVMAGQMFGELGNPRYVGYAEDILESGRYLLQLIESVLDLSSLEAGKVEVVATDVDVGDLLETVRRLLASKARDQGIAVQVTCADMLTVRSDARILKQILTNCLDNAIKYTEAGGTVSLHAGQVDGAWMVVVEDDGCGIPEHELARITEAFYRSPTNYSRMAAIPAGFGIGLSVVDRYVRALGGTLNIHSAEAEGTRITIDLPFDVMEGARDQTTSLTATPGNDVHPARTA